MSNKMKIYNVTICVLAIISLIFAVIDFVKGLNQIQTFCNELVYCIFFIDYVVRLVIAKDRRTFFKENIFDLIAIIPFNTIFESFRAVRFFKLAKLLKFTELLRIIVFYCRVKDKISKFFIISGFKYLIILVVMMIFISSFAMMHFEKMSFYDSLWWSFVTATTVGYGDLSPSTGIGRIIASMLMLGGIGLVGTLTSNITAFFINKNNVSEGVNSEKIDMVVTLYEKLSDEEKDIFKDRIDLDDK